VKKIAVIILLGILLFNWCGYQMITAWQELLATEHLQLNLDSHNYKESELISVKVPILNLAYYNGSIQFERVDGETEINGVQYSFVKRRLFMDSVELLCIPNYTATHLKKAKTDLFKIANDLQRPGQDKKPDSHTRKNLTGDFWVVNGLFRIGNQFYNKRIKTLSYSADLPNNSQPTDEHPPQVIA
jgi:hypothetical protein